MNAISPRSPRNKSRIWYVYIIETADQALYTGISTDTQRRFMEHVAMHQGVKKAKGAKFFRLHRPLRIVYQLACSDRSAASRAEAAIKKMSKQDKQAIIDGNISLKVL